jgi:hypothetical protein
VCSPETYWNTSQISGERSCNVGRADREAWWTLLDADLRTMGVRLFTVRGIHADGEVTDFRLKCDRCGEEWTFKIGVGGVLPHNSRVCPNQCNYADAHD